jgi:hypothetical protein
VLFTLKQPPPASFKLSAMTPFPCSITSKFPEVSKMMPRGNVRPDATILAANPGATEGEAYEGEIVVEHDV